MNRSGAFTRQFDKFADYEKNNIIVNNNYNIKGYVRESGDGISKEINIYTLDHMAVEGDLLYFNNRTWLVMGVSKDVESSGYDKLNAKICLSQFYIMDESTELAGTIYTIPYAIGTKSTGDITYINSIYPLQKSRADIFISGLSYTPALAASGLLPIGTPLFIGEVKYKITYVNKMNYRLLNLSMENTAVDAELDDRIIGISNRWKYDVDGKKNWEIKQILPIYQIFNVEENLLIKPQIFPLSESEVNPEKVKYILQNESVTNIEKEGYSVRINPIQTGVSNLEIQYVDAQDVPYAKFITRINVTNVKKKKVAEIRMNIPNEYTFNYFNSEYLLELETRATDGMIIKDSYVIESSNTDIAIFDEIEGKIKVFNQNGTSTFTIRSQYEPTFTTSLVITVDAKRVVEYKFIPASQTVYIGTLTDTGSAQTKSIEVWRVVDGVQQSAEAWDVKCNITGYLSTFTKTDPNRVYVIKNSGVGSSKLKFTFTPNPNDGTRPVLTWVEK